MHWSTAALWNVGWVRLYLYSDGNIFEGCFVILNHGQMSKATSKLELMQTDWTATNLTFTKLILQVTRNTLVIANSLHNVNRFSYSNHKTSGRESDYYLPLNSHRPLEFQLWWFIGSKCYNIELYLLKGKVKIIFKCSITTRVFHLLKHQLLMQNTHCFLYKKNQQNKKRTSGWEIKVI